MSKIYEGDVISIILDTKVDQGSDDVEIKYTKPDGTTGTWSDAAPNGNNIEYDTLTTDLDQHGIWLLHAFNDTDDVHGDLVEMRVHPLWEK